RAVCSVIRVRCLFAHHETIHAITVHTIKTRTIGRIWSPRMRAWCTSQRKTHHVLSLNVASTDGSPHTNMAPTSVIPVSHVRIRITNEGRGVVDGGAGGAGRLLTTRPLGVLTWANPRSSCALLTSQVGSTAP